MLFIASSLLLHGRAGICEELRYYLQIGLHQLDKPRLSFGSVRQSIRLSGLNDGCIP